MVVREMLMYTPPSFSSTHWKLTKFCLFQFFGPIDHKIKGSADGYTHAKQQRQRQEQTQRQQQQQRWQQQ